MMSFPRGGKSINAELGKEKVTSVIFIQKTIANNN